MFSNNFQEIMLYTVGMFFEQRNRNRVSVYVLGLFVHLSFCVLCT